MERRAGWWTPMSETLAQTDTGMRKGDWALSHTWQCTGQTGCKQCFRDTGVLFKRRDRATRELAEAFHIQIRGTQCISHPSVSILDKEVTSQRKMVKRNDKDKKSRGAWLVLMCDRYTCAADPRCPIVGSWPGIYELSMFIKTFTW